MKTIGEPPRPNPQGPSQPEPEPETHRSQPHESHASDVPEFGSGPSTPDPGEFPDDIGGDAFGDDIAPEGPAPLPSGVVDADKFYDRFLFAGHMVGMGVTAQLKLTKVPEAFAWETDPYGRRVSDGIHEFILSRPSLHWALSSDLEKAGLLGVIALFGFNRFMALRAELPGLIAERDALMQPRQGSGDAGASGAANDNLREQDGDTL